MTAKLTGGTLTPAYGRDYRSRPAVLADLNAGLDFVINTFTGSGYCSLSDLANGRFQVRDRSQRKLWSVTVKDGLAT